MPHFEELSVKNLYPQFLKDPNMMRFFPDKYPKGKGPPRDYFFNVLNTIYPEYLAKILAHADEQRYAADGEKMKNETIEISEYWAEQLKDMPYLSCKCLQLFSIILPASLLQRRMARHCIC